MKRPLRRSDVHAEVAVCQCPSPSERAAPRLQQGLAVARISQIHKQRRLRTAPAGFFCQPASLLGLLVLSVCLSTSPTASAAPRAEESLVTFSNKYYSPCGVSGNYSVVGFRGAFKAYPGGAPTAGLAGNISIFDDCYVAITV